MGDHIYEGVKKDFEMYSHLVREGGLLLFMIIVLYPPETRCEVCRFWNEVKHEYGYTEIVKDWKPEMDWDRYSLCVMLQ
jgi:hypothetical protein